MIDQLLTPWRIRTYALAALVALSLAFLLAVFGRPELTSEKGVPLGGDFVVFYAAGSLVAEGRAEELYERASVSRAQAAAVGTDSLPGTLTYVYPPTVALGFAPLSRLPYRGALVLHTLLAVGALALGFHVLAGGIPWLREVRGTALACALVTYPLTRSVAGGQNTAFSLALLAIALGLLLRPRTRLRELGAGLALGLLCFKPNFGLPFLGLTLLLWRPWILVGGAAGLGALYLSSAAVMGWSWPQAWWLGVSGWRGQEALRNGQDLISLAGVGEELFGAGGATVGLVLSGALALALAALFLVRGRRLALAWAVAVPGVLLLSPHTQFYDGGLWVLSGWILAAHAGARLKGALALVLLLSWSHGLTAHLPLQPLFLLNLGVAYLALRELRDPEPEGTPPEDLASAS